MAEVFCQGVVSFVFLNRMYNATEAIITGYCTIFVVDDGFINGVLSVPVYLCFLII